MTLTRQQPTALAVLILTYNEELNLPGALDSVCGWAQQVFVIDSYSDDRTLEIAEQYDVPVLQNEFLHWSDQRNWAFENAPIETDWALFLDADERVTPELAQEIADKLTTVDERVAGLYLDRRFFFLGRWLKHGGYSPNWVLRLTRPNRTELIPAGDREYFRVDGDTEHLTGYLIHEDQRDLAFWVAKHNRISALAAQYRLDSEASRNLNTQAGSLEGRRRIWIKDNLIARLPFWVQPLLYFFYRYIVRLGFLDGKAGLIYYVLHDFWYPWLIEAKVIEEKRKRKANL